MSPTREQKARQDIDAALAAAGWLVQDRAEMNLAAGTGVAVREFRMMPGHGFADYLLFVNGKAVGALEAKPAGYRLINVELQADKYARGLPAWLNPPVTPLPFIYMSTGVETRFINGLDPDPKTRAISANLPHIHRPETLAEGLAAETLDAWVKRLHAEGSGLYTAADDKRPSSLRGRITTIPPLENGSLYPNQIEAVTNLEVSLKRNRPRALIQMATGSGKTIAAITAIYRLIKYGGARRVLFLVDRSNLGEQAEKEFQGYRAPDVNRKFTEFYNVQRLASNNIMDSSRVVISTTRLVARVQAARSVTIFRKRTCWEFRSRLKRQGCFTGQEQFLHRAPVDLLQDRSEYCRRKKRRHSIPNLSIAGALRTEKLEVAWKTLEHRRLSNRQPSHTFNEAAVRRAPLTEIPVVRR